MSDAVRVVELFNIAWDARDLDAVMNLVTDDIVFESARIAAHGTRVAGRDAVRAAWAPGFARTSPGEMRIDEMIGAGDRVVQRWTFIDGDRHVYGVDVMRVRDGRLAEKFGYVRVSSDG